MKKENKTINNTIKIILILIITIFTPLNIKAETLTNATNTGATWYNPETGNNNQIRNFIFDSTTAAYCIQATSIMPFAEAEYSCSLGTNETYKCYYATLDATDRITFQKAIWNNQACTIPDDCAGGSLSLTSTNGFSKTEDGNYYSSNAITISYDGTKVQNYQLSLSGAPTGTIITDASGNTISENTTTTATTVYIKVPKEQVTQNLSITVNASSSYGCTIKSGTYYECYATKSTSYTSCVDGVCTGLIPAEKLQHLIYGSGSSSSTTKTKSASSSITLTLGSLEIQKYDGETNEPIEGVEFQLYTDATCLNEATTASGESIYFITDENGKAKVNGLLYGTYYLKEINSTNKYEILTTPEKITIDKEENIAPIKNQPIELIISKKDITGTNELAGAKIKITDSTGTMVLKEFTSGSEPTKFRIEKGTYILTEETAPLGYMPVEESIFFTIDEHGKITILSAENDKYLSKEDTITILNERTKIIVSKQDIASTEELAGAKIKVECDNGFFEEWISGEESRKLDIEPGATCTLKEEVAPKGYDKISSSLKFKVKEDGTVETIGTIDGAYYINKNNVIIYNTKEKVEVPDTGAFIAIGTILAGAVTTYTGYRFIKPRKRED